MKTIVQLSRRKVMTMLLGTLFSVHGYTQYHVTMGLKNITADLTTISYDLYVINDGQDPLFLSACSFGVNLNPAALNGGALSYTQLADTRDPAFSKLSMYSLACNQTATYTQARMTSTPVPLTQAVELKEGVSYLVGRFRICNAVPWHTNTLAALALHDFSQAGLTATQVVVYGGNSRQLRALTPAAGTVQLQTESSPVLHPDVKDAAQALPEIQADQVVSGSLQVYPNPVSDLLHVQFPDANTNPCIIQLIDMQGRMVKKILSSSHTGMNAILIDVKDLESGVYQLTLDQEGKTIQTSSFRKE